MYGVSISCVHFLNFRKLPKSNVYVAALCKPLGNGSLINYFHGRFLIMAKSKISQPNFKVFMPKMFHKVRVDQSECLFREFITSLHFIRHISSIKSTSQNLKTTTATSEEPNPIAVTRCSNTSSRWSYPALQSASAQAPALF